MRLIDADALSERLYELYKDSVRDGRVREARWDAIEALEAQPTIEAEPVRHGRWVGFVSYYGDEAVCSECKHAMCVNEPGNGLMNVEDLHYCPNCGAKMER